MLSMFLVPDTILNVISSFDTLTAAVVLILVAIAIWIIYELKTAPTVGDDYAREIDKAEDEAARS